MIREATQADLDHLLLLYTQLHNNEIPTETTNIHTIWNSILADNTLHFYQQAGYNKNDKTAFIQWL